MTKFVVPQPTAKTGPWIKRFFGVSIWSGFDWNGDDEVLVLRKQKCPSMGAAIVWVGIQRRRMFRMNIPYVLLFL
jgi:hypothetical protein